MKLTIGTANFLKKYGLLKTHVSRKEIIKIIKFIKKKKIRNLDTAFKYDAFFKLKNQVSLKEFNISTKLYFHEGDFKKNSLEKKHLPVLKKKINYCRLRRFETIFVHNFDDIKRKNYKKLFKFMNLLKKLNITKNTGISLYSPEKLNYIQKEYKINIVQAPINIFDRRFLSPSVIKILKTNKLALQARSIFLQGLLLKNIEKKNFQKFKNKKIFISFNNWCYKKNIDKIKVCVNFIKSQKNLSGSVIGVENLSQLLQILYYFKSKSQNIYPKKIFSNDLRVIDARKW